MSQASVESIESVQLVERSLREFAARVEQSLVEMEQEIRRLIDWLEHDRLAIGNCSCIERMTPLPKPNRR